MKYPTLKTAEVSEGPVAAGFVGGAGPGVVAGEVDVSPSSGVRGNGAVPALATHPSCRCRGLAVAVKSASIMALADDGVRIFGTGGARATAGSIRMNEHLGYSIEERWLSLAMPQ